MSLKKQLRSWLVRFLCSEKLLRIRRRGHEFRRSIRGRPHVVSVFLELDDPYSYLLCNYLPELASHYDIELKLYLTEAITGALRPAPELYPEYALSDCRRLARELGIPFLDKGASPPVEHRRSLLDALAARESQEDFNTELLEAINAYWRGDSAAVASRAEEASDNVSAEGMLARNQQLLERLGHYNTAMLHYGGEWYWGVDRLHYLVQRLDELGAATEPGLAPRIASIRQVMTVDLPVRPPATAQELPPLELFFSYRSPYSYLAINRIAAIADAFGVELVLRSVLPMVMRGMQVPRAKMIYIVLDASREARRLGIPFGKAADPVGDGIKRCMAVYRYAVSERKGLDFVVNATRAIWSKGIDVASDDGMRKVTAKTGLFWPEVVEAMQNENWADEVHDNRASMMASGSWGVPSVRIGDWISWGQDRDWLVARHLEELCDSGDGILV